MKTTIALSALLLLLGACASSQSMASSSAPGLQLHLAQTTGPSDIYYFRGPVNVQYAMQITNPTSETVTLRRLNISTIGPGAYSLRTGDSPMNYTIGPNRSVTIPLSAWGFAPGGFLRSSEPVNIRAVAFFQGANGSFVKQFTELIPQQ